MKLTEEEMKKNGIIRKKVSEIWEELEEIREFLLNKYHHARNFRVVYYDDMETRCILEHDGKYDYIFKDRYEKMLKKFKSGKVNTPLDYEIKEFNALALFMFNNPCEC